jgi:hypothetical protein
MENKRLAEKIFDIKERIETAKRKKAQAEGKLSTAYAELKKEFKVESIADATKLYDKMEKDRKETSDVLVKMISDIQRTLDETNI